MPDIQEIYSDIHVGYTDFEEECYFQCVFKKHILHCPDPEDYTVDRKLHKLQIFILKYLSG